MKTAEMFAIILTLAVLLAAPSAIAAEEKTAAVNSAVGAEAAPVKAPETAPGKLPETAPVKAVEETPAKAPEGELLDINSASAAQLQKILGIGEESAKQIIAGRPYVKKDQLKSRKIFTAAQYYKIKDRIIARKPKAVAKADRSR